MEVEGLRFPDGESVALGYVTDLYALLRAIDETMPKDATLYIEGNSIAAEIKSFLSSRDAPEPETFHLPLGGTNLTEFRALAEHHAEPEVADHLAVYRGDELLLTAHDAGDGEARISRALPKRTVQRLRGGLGDALR